jgi:heme oxygenase
MSDNGPDISLSLAFRRRTQPLHSQAERTGIIQEMLRGRATSFGYALLLRNLLPAYRQMEQALEQLRLRPAFDGIAQRAVYRAAAIETDLEAICGPAWAETLPLLSAGRCYADRIDSVAKGDGHRVIAHAYARYLGDLNGGQILKRLLGQTLGLAPAALNFYDFPAVSDLEAFKISYRDALDRSARAIEDIAPVVEEAAEAFALNIRVSEAVLAASRLDSVAASDAAAPDTQSAFETV